MALFSRAHRLRANLLSARGMFPGGEMPMDEVPATTTPTPPYDRARNLSGEDPRRGGMKSAERQARDHRRRLARPPGRPTTNPAPAQPPRATPPHRSPPSPP